MDATELRQEANRLSRLARDCSDPRVRAELETLAHAHITRAIEAERGRNYLPTIARFASWIGVLAVLTVGGSLALAEWYHPQPREIVETIEPPLHASHPANPAKPGSPPDEGERRVGTAEHGHLVTLLKNFPFPR